MGSKCSCFTRRESCDEISKCDISVPSSTLASGCVSSPTSPKYKKKKSSEDTPCNALNPIDEEKNGEAKVCGEERKEGSSQVPVVNPNGVGEVMVDAKGQGGVERDAEVDAEDDIADDFEATPPEPIPDELEVKNPSGLHRMLQEKKPRQSQTKDKSRCTPKPCHATTPSGELANMRMPSQQCNKPNGLASPHTAAPLSKRRASGISQVSEAGLRPAVSPNAQASTLPEGDWNTGVNKIFSAMSVVSFRGGDGALNSVTCTSQLPCSRKNTTESKAIVGNAFAFPDDEQRVLLSPTAAASLEMHPRSDLQHQYTPSKSNILKDDWLKNHVQDSPMEGSDLPSDTGLAGTLPTLPDILEELNIQVSSPQN
ncbi:hypothetical protein AAMO2058_000916400 [Amorphochlora amoebiformis]